MYTIQSTDGTEMSRHSELSDLKLQYVRFVEDGRVSLIALDPRGVDITSSLEA